MRESERRSVPAQIASLFMAEVIILVIGYVPRAYDTCQFLTETVV